MLQHENNPSWGFLLTGLLVLSCRYFMLNIPTSVNLERHLFLLEQFQKLFETLGIVEWSFGISVDSTGL